VHRPLRPGYRDGAGPGPWYQVNGKRRRITLGPVAALPLREARQQAGRIVADARECKDPLAGSRHVQRPDYLERRARSRQRPRTYVETERYLLKRWAPLHDPRSGGRTMDAE